MSMLMVLAAAVSGSFSCTPVAVWDGDGPIWCREGPRIRLSGIAAREFNGTCRPGHPCPDASGIAGRDALVRLLGGPRGRLATGHVRVIAPTMRCVGYGSAKGTRTAASCYLPNVGDLACAMVRSGTVARWQRYGGDRLCR